MGVYVFESKHRPFIKVGHYKGENAWRRIAPVRGFYSTSHPHELKGKLDPTDFKLRCWFPELGPKDESEIHNQLRNFRIIGEWYRLTALSEIKRLVPFENLADTCSFKEAMLYETSSIFKKTHQKPKDNLGNTVGYGDIYPTTTQGRFLAVGLMVSGICVLGVISATVAAWFVKMTQDDSGQR